MDADSIYMKLSDKLDKVIDKLDTRLGQVDQTLQNHERRIVVLEVHDSPTKGDWKNQLLLMLAKAVVVGGVTVASLAGASGILSRFFPG